jgi:hypothetical protein
MKQFFLDRPNSKENKITKELQESRNSKLINKKVKNLKEFEILLLMDSL